MTDTTGGDTLPSRFGLIFAGLMTVMLLASLDQTIVATALPRSSASCTACPTRRG